MNFAMMHGVKAALALQRTGSISAALAERSPGLSPHLSFMHASGHGRAVMRASASELEVEFVCVPRPIERIDAADGGPLAYRIAHRLNTWKRGSAPQLEKARIEGNLPLVAEK